MAKQNKSIIAIKVKFNAENYLHLTGLLSKQNSQNFFRNCINNNLKPNDIDFKYNSKITECKMNALPYLVKFHNIATSIGKYNKSKLNLKTDKIIGNNKKGKELAIGLIEIKNGDYYIPNSLKSELI